MGKIFGNLSVREPPALAAHPEVQVAFVKTAIEMFITEISQQLVAREITDPKY